MIDESNLTERWIKKAESDLKIALHELEHDDPSTDAICFHAQQVAEKYLKSYLVFHKSKLNKTHVLAMIIKDCCTINPDFQSLISEDVDLLTGYAVELRYPDEFYFPTVEEARVAVTRAVLVKEFVLEKLKETGYL